MSTLRSVCWPRIVLWLLVALTAVYAWRPLQGGEDFWAHAAVGRWILQTHQIPHETLWLWSTAPQPWIAHSWLSEIFLYLLVKSGGAHMALLATVVFVALPVIWLWKLWIARGGSAVASAFYFALALGCASVRFQPRPELFSYLCLVILFLFLIKRSEATTLAKSESTKRLRVNEVAIVVLFALWANLHGAVVLGIVVLTLTIVGDVLQKTNRKSVLTLALLCLLCVLAVNINPYGISYWSVLKPVGGEMFSMIDEWKSPLTAPTLPFEAFALLGMVVFVAALAWIGNPQRRWSHLLWLLFFCVMFLSARRNLWPLALTAIVVASANAGTLRAQHLFASAQISKQTINLFRAVAAGLLVMWTVSSLMPGTIATKESKVQVAAVSPFAPVGVAQYVIGHRPPQPVFNDYLRSGYYHWSFAGNPELYIDLHNAYPPSLLKEYFEIIGRTSAGIQAFENRNFQTVILGRWDQTSRVAPLANYLDASGEWDRKYSAVDGTVWVKK